MNSIVARMNAQVDFEENTEASTYIIENYNKLKAKIRSQSGSRNCEDLLNGVYLSIKEDEMRGGGYNPLYGYTVEEFILARAGKTNWKNKNIASKEYSTSGLVSDDDDSGRSTLDGKLSYIYANATSEDDGEVDGSLMRIQAKENMKEYLSRLQDYEAEENGGFNIIPTLKRMCTMRKASEDVEMMGRMLKKMESTVQRERKYYRKVEKNGVTEFTEVVEKSNYSIHQPFLDDLKAVLELASQYKAEYIEVLASI